MHQYLMTWEWNTFMGALTNKLSWNDREKIKDEYDFEMQMMRKESIFTTIRKASQLSILTIAEMFMKWNMKWNNWFEIYQN